ncbi:DUF5809 family protein [Natronomonas sp. LN261]|uniref:DUF5809 family protein n=1 Tax=Natronomonas sp. LN261 TaxID=2750669 RepID=UPI001C665F09|nr:DUF5809 family protein [Natronomonas sp. LN261]
MPGGDRADGAKRNHESSEARKPSVDDDPDEADAETRGRFTPESWADAEARYEALGTTAQSVVRETARAMAFEKAEYDDRVTGDVVETARQALFAETLAVRVADSEAFEAWREAYPGDVRIAGSDSVDRVAWHVSPPAETAVAATFQSEPDAAVGTVRRMAFNRIYRDRLSPTGDAA